MKPTNPFVTQARLDGNLYVREDAVSFYVGNDESTTYPDYQKAIDAARVLATKTNKAVSVFRVQVSGRPGDFQRKVSPGEQVGAPTFNR